MVIVILTWLVTKTRKSTSGYICALTLVVELPQGVKAATDCYAFYNGSWVYSAQMVLREPFG